MNKKHHNGSAFVLKQSAFLQGHPTSLILAPIESAYRTSYWSSVVTLIVSCLVSETLELSHAESHFFPYRTPISQNFGVFFL